MDNVAQSDASSHITFLDGNLFRSDFTLAMFLDQEDETSMHSCGEAVNLWIWGFIKN